MTAAELSMFYISTKKPFSTILPEKNLLTDGLYGSSQPRPTHKYCRQSMLALSQKPIIRHRRQPIEQREKNVNLGQIDIAIRYLCHSID